MPFSIHGFGTTYYGERDYRPDRSYVTTEWLVIGFVPVQPLQSLRVLYTSNGYMVLDRPNLNVRQVLSVYAWFVAFLGLAILATEFRWARKWLATTRQWLRGRFHKIRLKKAN